MQRNRFRFALALSAMAATFVMVAADVADARSRVSGGSRGTRTHTAPPPTTTAPTTAPVQRTMTQPTNPSTNVAARPGLQSSPAAGLMNRPGFMGGMFAGLLGAGLIGLLLGGGLTGGLAGLASFLGLALQIGIIALIGWLLYSWWQRRNQPATATAMGPSMRDVQMDQPRPSYQFGGLGGAKASASGTGTTSGLAGGYGSGLGAARPANPDEIGTTPADFDAFERLLGEVQTAYGAEDISKLRNLLTPELLSYFMDDLNANASRGVVNRISDVKLLQGDPAEAWREGDTDYCTVAIRYAIKDEIVDRASGRVIEGGPDEATEVWTFMRVRGGNWIVSAIQQTD
jgi:predicted lipid-binding transport protein (Tim44 family)